MTSVVSFGEAACLQLEELGGKGRNLADLLAAGFSVPGGFIVCASAYRSWISSLDYLSRAAEELKTEDAAHLAVQASELRARLESEPLPDDVTSGIERSLTAAGNGAFAVRSSSTFEDLADAAFAGQHDTYLNCVGTQQVIAHVRRCWCSLWTERAILYRHARGISHLEAAMAVVVQRQLVCRVAGVAFSIHPVSGDASTAAIDANYGLGESVVSGEHDVDHFEVVFSAPPLPGTDPTITKRLIGEKTERIVPDVNGTRSERVPADLQSVPCLSDEEIIRVAMLAKSLERHYGWPQDIEWGIVGAELFLLQARAITLVPPRWTRDESAERWPKPITPLSWDYMASAFRASLPYSMRIVGLPAQDGMWFECHGYHVYGNQNLLDVIKNVRPIRAKLLPDLIVELPALRERYAAVLDLPTTWMRDLDRYLLRMGALTAQPVERLSLEEAFQNLEGVSAAAEDYIKPNIAISISQAFLYGILESMIRLVSGVEPSPDGTDRATRLFDDLLAGIDCKTVEVNRELYDLARMLRSDPILDSTIRSKDAASFLAHDIGSFPDFAARFEDFLSRHGHRELFMDYFYPTWKDSPEVVVELMKAIPGDAERPDAKVRAGRIRFANAELALLSAVPESTRFFFRELIRLSRSFTALDDLEHYQTTRINPAARRAMLRIGTLLTEQGILEHPDHVFFLRRDELRSVVTGMHSSVGTVGAVTAKRHAEFLAAHHVEPDWELGKSMAAHDPSSTTLTGIPGSPGIAEGECFIVEDTDQFKIFPRGAILVSRTTNPAWTPLFYLAAGLVTESGGPLSHGAVTAREMHLPAVMAVRGITSRLKTGDRVRVDGSAGRITVL